MQRKRVSPAPPGPGTGGAGGTDGLGRALAADLLRAGATVLVHGRDPGRIADTVASLGGGARVRSYCADFSSQAQVRELAAQVIAAEPALNVLVNNAGIGGAGQREESADGYELRFAVNYLAGFTLTRQLLPLLTASAPSRIVNVSSAGQQAVDFGNVMLTSGYSPMRAYCQSKLAQIIFTMDLAPRLAEADVTVNALHAATSGPEPHVASRAAAARPRVPRGSCHRRGPPRPPPTRRAAASRTALAIP